MPALDGMRILDMTQYEAGTSCTQALAWLGADVVKIEKPGVGDPGRGLDLGLFEDAEYFVNWNSNKRSVTLNLESPEGRALLLKMLPKYDVFIENYGPGVIEKMDLGYEVMKAIHPGIIYGRIKGFGTSGPYAKYKSFDVVAQAASGALSTTGEAGGTPMRNGPTIGDVGTGVQMALAITAAYVQKMRTGVGQLIEISMQEAVTYFMRTTMALGSKWGTRPAERRGNGLNPVISLYPCTPFGANDHVYIMCVTQRLFERLCTVIGRDELRTDPRFAEPKARRENGEALRAEITTWTRARTKREAMHTLCEGGIPASAVFDTTDLFNDPHLKSRGFIHKIPHEALGEIPLLGFPPRLSESEVPIKAAPLLGKHTAEVLAQDLGMDATALKTLRDSGIVGNER
jgi:crotonobetainyl-CoA:carnitine CoA-transferase CaiB-like acyl-CoA transferase